MAQLYLKGVYYDTESEGLWYLDNSGTYQEISTGGGSSYLVYTALLSQTGTDAPVPTVLENTLGGTVVFARDDVGYYTATLAGAFTIGKTFITIGSGTGNLSRKFIAYPHANTDFIEIESGTFDGTSIDGVMNGCQLEIRAYP